MRTVAPSWAMADCSPKAATHAPHAADSVSRRVISKAEGGLLAVMTTPQYAIGESGLKRVGSHASRGLSLIRYAHDRANVRCANLKPVGQKRRVTNDGMAKVRFDNGWD